MNSITISSTASAMQIIRKARAGVSAELFFQVVREYTITADRLAQIVGVNLRTIKNYKTQQKPLPALQGEQLLKFIKLSDRGAEVFGSGEAFSRWLQKPAYGLDGEIPDTLLDTPEGMQLVADELERIAYGDLA